MTTRSLHLELENRIIEAEEADKKGMSDLSVAKYFEALKLAKLLHLENTIKKLNGRILIAMG